MLFVYHKHKDNVIIAVMCKTLKQRWKKNFRQTGAFVKYLR